MLHPGRCARLVSVVWHCRPCKHGNPDYFHLKFHVGGTNCLVLPEQGRPSLPSRSFRRPNSSESTSPPNWHFDYCVTCNYSSYISALLFIFYFILFYFLCKVVFIVTPCFLLLLA